MAYKKNFFFFFNETTERLHALSRMSLRWVEEDGVVGMVPAEVAAAAVSRREGLESHIRVLTPCE